MNDFSLSSGRDSCFLKFFFLLFIPQQQSALHSEEVVPEVWANEAVCHGGKTSSSGKRPISSRYPLGHFLYDLGQDS